MTWRRRRCAWCHHVRWTGRVVVDGETSVWLCLDCDESEFWVGMGDDADDY